MTSSLFGVLLDDEIVDVWTTEANQVAFCVTLDLDPFSATLLSSARICSWAHRIWFLPGRGQRLNPLNRVGFSQRDRSLQSVVNSPCLVHSYPASQAPSENSIWMNRVLQCRSVFELYCNGMELAMLSTNYAMPKEQTNVRAGQASARRFGVVVDRRFDEPVNQLL